MATVSKKFLSRYTLVPIALFRARPSMLNTATATVVADSFGNHSKVDIWGNRTSPAAALSQAQLTRGRKRYKVVLSLGPSAN